MRYAYSGAAFLPVLVLLSLSIAACDTSVSGSETDSDPLFPLAVGNAWVMEITDKIGAADPAVLLDTVRVARDTLVGNERWFELSSRWGFGFVGALNSTSWYALRDDGLWRLDSNRIPVKVIEHPSEVGSTTSPRPGISYTRIAEDSTLTLEGLGTVRTIPYAVRFHDGYQVTENLDRTYQLRGDTTVIHHFSQELGFVRIGGLWARLDANDQLVPIGSRTRRLIEFIPESRGVSINSPSRQGEPIASHRTSSTVLLP